VISKEQIEERWKWTVAILSQHGKCHDNWYFGKFRQPIFLWFHSIKAIICLWLGLRKKNKTADTVDMIACRDFRKFTHWEFGSDAEWYELSVGFGWKHNWFIETYFNSWL
jgi:hypothetical protein